MRARFSWQLIVVVASLLYLMLVSIIILLLLRNILLSIAVGVTVIVLVYAAWLVFTGEGRRARLGYGLGVPGLGALAAELIYLLRDEKNRRAVLLITLLSVAYLGLVTLLRKQYWREVRRLRAATGRTANFKKPYLIINPKSGNGRAIKAGIDKLARVQGIHVIIMRKGDEIIAIAQKAASDGADVLGISGGDGSIGAVAKVALEHDLPLVVLPGGTKCHFARDLGLPPERIADALASFSGVERHIDVATLNGRIFLNNASFGLYADIVDHPDYREHKMQVARDVLQSIVEGKKDLYDLQFRHGRLRVRRAVQVLVGVNRYDTLHIFELGHRKKLNEGVLQITAVTDLNDQTMRRIVRRLSTGASGKSESIPGVYQWIGTEFNIATDGEKLLVGVDGEREEYDSPVTARVLPAALRVYVPAEGIRGRPKNPFDLRKARRAHSAIGAFKPDSPTEPIEFRGR